MTTIAIRGLSKAFGPLEVLKKINLEVKDGEFIVVFGPNGCGKSTLLNCIAGLEEPSGGSMAIGGKPDFPNEVLFIVFSKDYAEKNPETVEKFLRGLKKAMEFMKSNEEETLEINSKVHNIPVEDLKQIWPDFEFKLSFTDEELNYLKNEAQWAIAAGKVPRNASIPDFCDFIYSKPLQEIVPDKVTLNC